MKYKVYKDRYPGYIILWLSLLLPAVFTSCIGDDMDSCPVPVQKVNICFTYTFNEEGRDLFKEDIHDLSLYLYSHDGSFSGVRYIRADTLVDGQRTSLELDPGQYTAVVWGNTNDASRYYSHYGTHINDMRLDFLPSVSGGIENDCDSLYHGLYRLRVDPGNDREHYIDLKRNTHDIRVLLIVENTPANIQTGDYTIDIGSSNGSYKYDNTFLGGILRSAPTYATVGNDRLIAQVRTLRLIQGDNSYLHIRDRDGKVDIRRSLSSDLLEDPRIIIAEDLDKIHRHQLVYRITHTPNGDATTVFVSVGDWDLVNIDEPL